MASSKRKADDGARRLERALAHEQRVSRALREVGSALGATLDLDDLLELILEKLTELLDAKRSTLYLLDESTGDLVSRIVVGQQIKSIRLKVGHGIAGTVAKTGKPIRVTDAYADPRFEPEWDLLTGFKTTSMLAAPLKNHLGRTIGVIQVFNKQGVEDGFTEEDEAILGALSTQAAVAIDNSRLFLSLIQKNKQLLDTKDQLELRVKDLELLFELERSTGRAVSIEDLAVAALGAAASATGAQGAAMVLAEESSGDLVVYSLDQDDPKLRRRGAKSGKGILSAAMSSEDALHVTDARTDPLCVDVGDRFSFPIASAMAVALEGGDSPIGALGIFSSDDLRGLSDDEESLLKLVSANVSTAVRLFRASEARERSERLTTIGRLLSGVVHDFKTPLAVISGYVQLLVGTDDRAQRNDYADKILRQFDVITSMQREVLEFARGERNVFVRKVYLHKFFSDIREQLGQEIDGRAIELSLDIDTKVVARFDESRVARAVQNLARNAIEAMAERGGVLTIQAGMEGDDLLIRVSDTGPGIPPEIEGRVFQLFVTAGKSDGTGLGLAIVKKIVDEHGGRVEVDSSDAGATFTLRFPQPRDDAPVAKKKRASKKRAKGKARSSTAKSAG